MKKTFTARALMPKYVTQFQCIGGDCPDTCCAGWQISIDKQTFSDYRRVVHPALKPLLKANLEQDDKSSRQRYGKLNLRESDGRCAMHSSQGLCSVHQHLGEAALSDTCYHYPRMVQQYGDRFEQCLSLSCPEAARLALTQGDAFEFVSAPLTTRVDTTIVRHPVHGFDLLAMDEVRAFSVQLFQTEGVTNIERLAVLGWMCQQIDNLVAANSQAQLPELLLGLTELVQSGKLKEMVGQLMSQHSIGVTIFYMLFGNPMDPKRPANQQTVLAWVQQGLGISAGKDGDLLEIEARYRRGMVLLTQNGEMFEKMVGRYLLNDLIRETFPWDRSSALLHYRRLLTRFGVVRLMLAAVAAAHEKPLDDKTMAQVIQVFCRLYQHNLGFATGAEKSLVGLEWDRLDRLYSLLN